MPWIRVIRESEAEGELKGVYEHIARQRAAEQAQRPPTVSGETPIFPPALHSLNPQAMRYTADLMWEIMRGESRLTTAQREMIATVTSAAAYCRY